jgi:hypothetical protein
MWEVISDFLFPSLPPKVQVGCIVVGVTLVAGALVWATH